MEEVSFGVCLLGCRSGGLVELGLRCEGGEARGSGRGEKSEDDG